jgi:hypothetical protein
MICVIEVAKVPELLDITVGYSIGMFGETEKHAIVDLWQTILISAKLKENIA